MTTRPASLSPTKLAASALTPDLRLFDPHLWFKYDEDADRYDFLPFYDESYAALIPSFNVDFEDFFPTPDWLDDKDYKYLSEPPDGRPGISSIYYVQCPSTGLIKIGTAKNLPGRLSSLRTGAAIPLVFLSHHVGNREYEKMLHKIFAPIRSHKEWFWPHEKLCEWIASYTQGERIRMTGRDKSKI